jgi:Cu2+-containing amine oxidase
VLECELADQVSQCCIAAAALACPFGHAHSADVAAAAAAVVCAAIRDVSSDRARVWKVKSRTTRNRADALTSYKLVPTSGVKPMCRDNCAFLIRAGFLKHHLWVTPYTMGENYPGGPYPNQVGSSSS